MNVWSYWRCPSCRNIIRGDNKSCPCCGAPIPNGVKYMMPDNPEVISAMDRGEIITGKEDYKKEVSSAGIVEEIVPTELESDKPNWNCIYCGYQNAYENTSCVNCGAGKEEAEEDYFGNKPTFDEKNKKEFETRKGQSYDDFVKEIEEPSVVDFPNEDGGETEPELKESFLTKAKDGISDFFHSDVFPLAAKIKTLLYFEMHRAKNNGVITLERIVDLIRANDHYEFLSYFPEYQSVFDDVKRQIDHSEVVLEKVRQDVAEWKNNNKDVYEQDERLARKWFAQDLGKKGPLYFAEYDGKLAHTVDSLETKKFISLFKIELKEG